MITVLVALLVASTFVDVVVALDRCTPTRNTLLYSAPSTHAFPKANLTPSSLLSVKCMKLGEGFNSDPWWLYVTLATGDDGYLPETLVMCRDSRGPLTTC